MYVYDRTNDRIQVFHEDGTLVNEAFVRKTTIASGSVWDIAFSKDPQQKDNSIAADSKGHIYTTETYEGKRVQRCPLRRPRRRQDVGHAVIAAIDTISRKQEAPAEGRRRPLIVVRSSRWTTTS